MNERILQFKAGLKDGVPIGLGYLAVSFTFGIMQKVPDLLYWKRWYCLLLI